MTFSYVPGSGRARDRTRFYLGDTNPRSAQFLDEEIDDLLTVTGNALLTAAALAESLAAKYSKAVSFSIEGLSIQNSTKVEHYRSLASMLRNAAAAADGSLGVPVLTGVSLGEMALIEENPDRPPHYLKNSQSEELEPVDPDPARQQS